LASETKVLISELRLANFRNYSQLNAEFEAGMTLLFGENGQGKTNLVEAISFIANFHSHRVSGYQALIQEGFETAQLAVTARVSDRSLQLAVELNRSSPNRYWINQNLRRRASDLAGAAQVVTFSPEDLDIIRRDPADRRAFLDQLVTQLDPRLASVAADYERVLRQRNALLKSARSNADLSTLDIWNDQLASLGVQIMRARQAAVDLLRPSLTHFYSVLIDSPAEINLEIESKLVEGATTDWLEAEADEQQAIFIEKLEAVRSRELERGITLIGPHRDELVILLDDKTAREHASQGEAWSLALGAKLATAQLLKENSTTGDPVLILDDVFSVLDPNRRERLSKFVSENEQVFVTATSESGLPEVAWAAQHKVVAGELERV
jgi:DNA replication and repair protein RecF